jgi:hypothetical protein
MGGLVVVGESFRFGRGGSAVELVVHGHDRVVELQLVREPRVEPVVEGVSG